MEKRVDPVECVVKKCKLILPASVVIITVQGASRVEPGDPRFGATDHVREEHQKRTAPITG